MRPTGGKVVVLELNEITWDLMEPMLASGALPNFSALIDEGAHGTATANEAPQNLDPWVTWTTVYTGVPQSQHGLSMLEQDKSTVGARRLWEHLADDGRRIGLFGSANSWPPETVNGFWIPGPFSRDFAAYPARLTPIQELNVGLTRGHTAADIKPPSMKSLLPKLIRLGLKPRTVAGILGDMVSVKRQPRTRWKMVSLQPIINMDLFAALYRQFRPDFATLHSNHIAYYQHRFWRAMQPERFDVPPSAEERATYAGAIQHGYVVADRLLGKLRRLVGSDTTIVVLGSLGAQPATGGRYSDDQRNGHVGLQVRIGALLELLQLTDKVQYSNLMAPQWKIDFQDHALLERTAAALRNARNTTRNVPAFAAAIEGDSICMGANRNQELGDTIEVDWPGGPVRVNASEVISRHSEVVKSGRHHPDGVLIMTGAAIKAGVKLDTCDNLDIAPTLLTLLGAPIPSVMSGRVLTEALNAAKVAAPQPAAA